MILSIGIDITEVYRIRETMKRTPRFGTRVFTKAEREYCDGKGVVASQSYAARFAAKEAFLKAIGTGWKGGVRWQDFEVANLPSGKPTLKLHGVAAEVALKLGVRNVALSITHTAQQGMAFVILED